MNSTKEIICIDIGSTYTKGALFNVNNNNISIIEKHTEATSQNHLYNAFSTVAGALLNQSPNEISWQDTKLYYSSSAKGGLKIAAVGIVPDLTMKMARETALSAGAKITGYFSYKLTDQHIKQLNQLNPDIVLFSGGTDGGNEKYNLHNAEMLNKLSPSCIILYAGNQAIIPDIKALLKGRQLVITENILPELHAPNPEPARQQIRQLFLEQIVTGKGLSEIIEKTGQIPLPTPAVMLDYVKIISETVADWSEFCLIDMGGATTDFYSAGGNSFDNPSVVYKGLQEEFIKRSVEGDLGMRVSAQAVFASAQNDILSILKSKQLDEQQFNNYLANLTLKPSIPATTVEELEFDKILAQICISYAAQRHAGQWQKVYTSNGEVCIQRGKNLQNINKIIGSGGFLPRNQHLNAATIISEHPIIDKDSTCLTPLNPAYYIDSDYCFPLFANLARCYPEPAAKAGINTLKKVQH